MSLILSAFLNEFYSQVKVPIVNSNVISLTILKDIAKHLL